MGRTCTTRKKTGLHNKQLKDIRDQRFLEVARRSALGLVAVYNLLPQDIIDAEQVKDFQAGLQNLVKKRAESGHADWKMTLSSRVPMYKHPLRIQSFHNIK